MTNVVTMRQLLEAGVHFGHRTSRWNPKMRPFIFTERNGIHIIDLHQTMVRINQYYDVVRDRIAEGGVILFVGTKRQAQGIIQQEATRCGMPYVNIRWLGGTLTNWKTIKQRIDYLNELERRMAAGEFRNLTKKEQLRLQRLLTKLQRRLGGLKHLKRLPDMIYVVDTHREELAVKEANKVRIPIVGIVDTNADPDLIDYPIPGNDDAIRSIKLITGIIADAVEEGRRIREVHAAEAEEVAEVSAEELEEMEQYLGPSTLAKLQLTGVDEELLEEVEEELEEVVEEPEAATEEAGPVATSEAEAEEPEPVAAEEDAGGAEEALEETE